MRRFFLFLLLLSGWAVIFSPWLSGESVPSLAFSPQAHPSNQPLPKAWQDTQRVPVHAPASSTTVDASTKVDAATKVDTTTKVDAATVVDAPQAAPPLNGSACGATYAIQSGDALGKIAQKCGITLAGLLKANPQIVDPNRIYPGQPITIPNGQAGKGGSSVPAGSANLAQGSGFQPGAGLEIDAAGLPPNTTARIGLGLSTSGYIVLGERQTDANGRLAVNLPLPDDLHTGESAFIMITTMGYPAVQRTSETFIIGQP